jgi:hypothetical protein
MRLALQRAPEASLPDAPGPFAFGERSRVERVLGDAGFTNVDVQRFDAEVVVSSTGIADAVTFCSNAGPAARLLGELPAGQRGAGVQAIAEALRQHARDQRVSLGGATWVVTARAP